MLETQTAAGELVVEQNRLKAMQRVLVMTAAAVLISLASPQDSFCAGNEPVLLTSLC